MSKQKAEKKESIGYQQMLSELDELVRHVSQGSLDLDEVVERIEHGYKLIAMMRERLDATKSKVEKLRVDFESPREKPPVGDSDADDDDAPF